MGIITVIKILIEFCSLNSFNSYDVKTLVRSTKPFYVPSNSGGGGDMQLNAILRCLSKILVAVKRLADDN